MKIAVTLLPLLFAGNVWAQCTRESVDETLQINTALTTYQYVKLDARQYCVNGRTGIRIPGGRTLDLTGATVGIIPGCTGVCKALETVVGSQYIRIVGGEVVGDPTQLVGFQVGLRVDSASDVEVYGTHFRNWKSDGFWLGGNLGSHRVTFNRIRSTEFGRNGGSLVNGSFLRIYDSEFRNCYLPNGDPCAALDIEGNPGDQVTDVIVSGSTFADSRVGIYCHAGQIRNDVGEKHKRIKIQDNVFVNNRIFGMIVNGTDTVSVEGNYFENNPEVSPNAVGLTVGAAGAPVARATTDDFVVRDNRFRGYKTSIRLAGVRGVRGATFGPNDLGTGAAQPVAPNGFVPATQGLILTLP